MYEEGTTKAEALSKLGSRSILEYTRLAEATARRPVWSELRE